MRWSVTAHSTSKPSKTRLMKTSTRTSLAGTANLAKGEAKVVTGKALGRRLLQAKGRAQKLIGRMQKQLAKDQKRNGQ